MIDMPIIRVLYGDLVLHHKVKREVAHSLKTAWMRDEIEHYVIGLEHADYPKSLGAKKIKLLHDEPFIVSRDINHYYNKAWLLEQAAQDHPEFVFIDFDCNCLRTPDDEMCRLLRQRNRSFMASCVQYVRPLVNDYFKLRTRSQRFHLSTAVLYYCGSNILFRMVGAYDTLLNITTEKLRTHMIDETPLMYLIDHDYGLLNKEQLVAEFETPIAKFRRSVPEADAIPKTIYFGHK